MKILLLLPILLLSCSRDSIVNPILEDASTCEWWEFWCDNSTEPVSKDCAGVVDGTAIIDDCGICGGDNSTCIDDSAIYTYQLEDLNSNSSTFEQILSHNNFLGKAILYYFPSSDTWLLCKSRFDSLNALYLEYGGVSGNIVIIGIGKNNGNTIYTVSEDTILPYVKETDDYKLRDELGVVDRDVYFYNTSGDYVNTVNLTAEFNKSHIKSIINSLLN